MSTALTGKAVGGCCAVLFAVQAAAAPTCSIGSVVGVGFGAYDVFAAGPVDSTGSISYSCFGVGGADTVSIEISTGGAGGYSPRQMTNGAHVLSYNLYLDAARSVVWGDGFNSSSRYGPLTPAEGSTQVPVYGRIPAGQMVAAGEYADTVVVTLVF